MKPDVLKLSDEQVRAWKRWRRRYATAEEAGEALCPCYLVGVEKLSDKLEMCKRQRILEGVTASQVQVI